MDAVDLFHRLGEAARMQALARFDLFHPELTARLDTITARTAARLGTEVCMVSVLLDSAQVILSDHGIPGGTGDAPGVPAQWALCTNAVLTARPYLVPDSTVDPAHADNPMLAVTGLRSYAGVPLIDDDGLVLGAHCVLDLAPRQFTEQDVAVLSEGAEATMRVLGEYHLAVARPR